MCKECYHEFPIRDCTPLALDTGDVGSNLCRTYSDIGIHLCIISRNRNYDRDYIPQELQFLAKGYSIMNRIATNINCKTVVIGIVDQVQVLGCKWFVCLRESTLTTVSFYHLKKELGVNSPVDSGKIPCLRSSP